MMLFIAANVGVSIVQIILLSAMIMTKAAKRIRLTVHLILSSIVLALLIIGCFLFFQQKQYTMSGDIDKSSEKYMMMHLNFTVSLMIWFRFIECFMCTCIYLSTLIVFCSQSSIWQLNTSTNKPQLPDNGTEFVDIRVRRYNEATDVDKVCSICLSDFCTDKK